MPGKRRKGGGGAAQRRKAGKAAAAVTSTALTLKEDDQEYAIVTKMLGAGHVQGTCCDGKERMLRIRGSMKRKIWIGMGDMVLIGLRSFQDTHADIILKYTADEARRLKAIGELPDSLDLSSHTSVQTTVGGDDDMVAFIEAI